MISEPEPERTFVPFPLCSRGRPDDDLSRQRSVVGCESLLVCKNHSCIGRAVIVPVPGLPSPTDTPFRRGAPGVRPAVSAPTWASRVSTLLHSRRVYSAPTLVSYRGTSVLQEPGTEESTAEAGAHLNLGPRDHPSSPLVLSLLCLSISSQFTLPGKSGPVGSPVTQEPSSRSQERTSVDPSTRSLDAKCISPVGENRRGRSPNLYQWVFRWFFSFRIHLSTSTKT